MRAKTAPPDGERRIQLLRELVRNSYEQPLVVARYTTVGLWPAEEILALEHIPDQARILDLGCGAGRCAIALAELGLEVVGVDLSRAMIEAARLQAQMAGVKVEFQVMDAMDLELQAESFEVVLCAYNGLELLPGIQGKKQALAEVWRVLEAEGRFIFSTHSLFALNYFAPYRFLAFVRLCLGRAGWPVRELELGERFIDDEWEEAKYLQILPPSTWKRLLRAQGFELVYFNTRQRLETRREWGFPGHFEDGERFYVARKRGAPVPQKRPIS
ncbi:MAG: class I SAM-dependent methyltransferase [Candidatus Latescibacteria bacterium]|nr:class I SAM-dependent methyltransferase [Candidatus Latescibacterota bacterium]